MKIKYNRANVYKCGELVLLPGVNEILEKTWAKFSCSKGVLSRIESGEIVVMSGSSAAQEIQEPSKRGRKPKDSNAPVAENESEDEGFFE